MKKPTFLQILLNLLLLSALQAQVADVPANHWLQYATPEAAGFSPAKLDTAKRMFEQSEAAAG